MSSSLIKRFLPAPWPEVIWNWRHYSSWHAQRAWLDYREQPSRQQRYEELNKGLGEDEQVLNDEIKVNVIPEMRRILELYAYLDMRNVVEMSGFLRYARGRSCLLDIGALYGDFSMIFCAMTGGTAFAIDPSPEAQGLLEKIMAVNPSLDIRPYAVALSSENGSLCMAREWIHCVAVTDEHDHQGETVQVRQATMDSFLTSLKMQPDTLKIDAEGFELDIIRGGADYLRKHQPRILRKRHQHVHDLVAELKASGFTIYHPDGKVIRDPEKVLSKSEGYFVHRVICDVVPPGRGGRLPV